MKLFAANLKLLYQKSGMLGWYLIVGIGLYTYLSRSIRESQPENLFHTGFASPLLVLIAAGSAFGRLYTDAWNKPTFFCLPEQRKTSRNVILFLGIILSGLISLSIHFLFPWMTKGVHGATIMMISYYLMVYLINATIAYYFFAISVVILSVSYFFFPIMGRIGLWYALNSFLLNHMWVSTFVFCLISLLLYTFFGRTPHVRSLKRTQRLSNYKQAGNPESGIAAPEMPFAKKMVSRTSGFVDHLFFDRIRKNSCSFVLPHSLGRIYVILKSLLLNWKMIIFLNLFFFFISCITVTRYNTFNLLPVFFSIFGILVGFLCLIPKTDIFFPVSRKERFFVEITTVLTAIFISLIFASLIVLLSKILPRNIIMLMFGPDPSLFRPFNAKYIVFAVILLPATSAVIKIFRNKIVSSAIVLTGVALCVLGVHFYPKCYGIDKFNGINSYFFVLIMLVSLGFYLATIYYDSFKRSFY